MLVSASQFLSLFPRSHRPVLKFFCLYFSYTNVTPLASKEFIPGLCWLKWVEIQAPSLFVLPLFHLLIISNDWWHPSLHKCSCPLLSAFVTPHAKLEMHCWFCSPAWLPPSGVCTALISSAAFIHCSLMRRLCFLTWLHPSCSSNMSSALSPYIEL